jgi:hypothetical protein
MIPWWLTPAARHPIWLLDQYRGEARGVGCVCGCRQVRSCNAAAGAMTEHERADRIVGCEQMRPRESVRRLDVDHQAPLRGLVAPSRAPTRQYVTSNRVG